MQLEVVTKDEATDDPPTDKPPIDSDREEEEQQEDEQEISTAVAYLSLANKQLPFSPILVKAHNMDNETFHKDGTKEKRYPLVITVKIRNATGSLA